MELLGEKLTMWRELKTDRQVSMALYARRTLRWQLGAMSESESR